MLKVTFSTRHNVTIGLLVTMKSCVCDFVDENSLSVRGYESTNQKVVEASKRDSETECYSCPNSKQGELRVAESPKAERHVPSATIYNLQSTQVQFSDLV